MILLKNHAHKHVQWGAFNLLPKIDLPNGTKPFNFSDVYAPGAEPMWQEIVPLIYADGSNQAPLLRDPANPNYLSEAFTALGFTLFSIVAASALGASIWLLKHREHRVVTASQPPFLHMINVGCIIFVSAIIPLSFDERGGWTAEQLSE